MPDVRREGRKRTFSGRSVLDPFDEHEGHEVTEEGPEEQHPRQELYKDFAPLFKVGEVPQSEDDAEGHVEDGYDDGQLHLVGIQENDLVLCADPHGIQSERIGSLSVVAGFRFRIQHDGRFLLQHFVRDVDFPRRAENVERTREDVVVDETRVHGEKAHHQDDVAPAKEDTEHLHFKVKFFFRFNN